MKIIQTEIIIDRERNARAYHLPDVSEGRYSALIILDDSKKIGKKDSKHLEFSFHTLNNPNDTFQRCQIYGEEER
jgi:hypothetical protein